LKVRLGFVSNSSSVSFLIATKKELTESQLKNKLLEYFRLKNKESNRSLIKAAVDTIFSSLEFVWQSEQEAIDAGEGSISFYENTKGKGYKLFYPGGIDPNVSYSYGIGIEDLYGIEINDDDLYLIVDRSF